MGAIAPLPPAGVKLAYTQQKCATFWQKYAPNLTVSACNLQKKVFWGGYRPSPDPSPSREGVFPPHTPSFRRLQWLSPRAFDARPIRPHSYLMYPDLPLVLGGRMMVLKTCLEAMFETQCRLTASLIINDSKPIWPCVFLLVGPVSSVNKPCNARSELNVAERRLTPFRAGH